MVTRVLSSVIGLPILIFFVSHGGWPLKTSIAIIALTGMAEFYSSVFKKFNTIQFVCYSFSIIYCFLVDKIFYQYLGFFFSLLLLSVFFVLVIKYPKYNIYDGAFAFIGFYYVCFFISYAYLVRYQPSGNFFVWLIFICAWGSDTGAYFAGKKWGNHKLVPLLSPKKTVEGAIGGVFTAALLAFVYGFIYYQFFAHENNAAIIFLSTTIGAAGGALSQFGDLTASSVKRHTGIKDFGKIIPGHGGFLDRFDSVLFTAPVVYYICTFLGAR